MKGKEVMRFCNARHKIQQLGVVCWATRNYTTCVAAIPYLLVLTLGNLHRTCWIIAQYDLLASCKPTIRAVTDSVKSKENCLIQESLKGARVLVTGASTGIGEQMAYHYARFGAKIVITARRENVLQQVVERCLSLGAQKALYIAADMANESDPDKVVDFALEKLGGLDYVVLNHIGPTPFSMWEGDVEHTRWLMKVNFFSYIQMAWKALPSLEQSKGSLVVVSSVLGKMSSPFAAPYSSTKFALNGFFGALYHELAMKKSNVSVSICTLGLIDTESAMEKVRGVTNIQAYPATEAALNIIKTGATKQQELYYPWYTHILCLSKDWFPSVTNFFIQNSYNYSP